MYFKQPYGGSVDYKMPAKWVNERELRKLQWPNNSITFCCEDRAGIMQPGCESGKITPAGVHTQHFPLRRKHGDFPLLITILFTVTIFHSETLMSRTNDRAWIEYLQTRGRFRISGRLPYTAPIACTPERLTFEFIRLSKCFCITEDMFSIYICIRLHV